MENQSEYTKLTEDMKNYFRDQYIYEILIKSTKVELAYKEALKNMLDEFQIQELSPIEIQTLANVVNETNANILKIQSEIDERNTEMENNIEVNRITDDMIKLWSSQIMVAASMDISYEMAKRMAFDTIKEEFGIDKLTSSENAKFVAPGKKLRILFPEISVTRKGKTSKHDIGATKKCHRCREQKPLSDFSMDRNSPDGKQNWCKQCWGKYNAEKREKNSEQTANLLDLFKTKEVTVEDISMKFIRNNMQIRYENNEFLYSPIEGCQFNDADVEDLLILRSLAKSKVEKFNGAN